MGHVMWQRDRSGEKASQLECEISVLRLCIRGSYYYQQLFCKLDGFLSTGQLFATY